MSPSLPSEYILNHLVTCSSKKECLDLINKWIVGNNLSTKYFVCLNPHSYEVSLRDQLFYKSIEEADFVIPDGIGIVYASQILKGRIRSRITGYDIFEGVSQMLNGMKGKSCFFLGSSVKNLEQISKKMAVHYPDLKVAGCYSPPFRDEFSESDIKEMLDAILAAKPDVLWVGMTAPKQEKWIYNNINKLEGVKFVGPIGAVFDFYSGNLKRGHPVLLNIGLEWLPRLLKQPRRLWKRNLISNPSFMFRVIKKGFQS